MNPAVALEKSDHARFTVCTAGCEPDPLIATENGDPGALLASVRVAAKFVAEAGVKVMVRDVDPPGGMERGSPKVPIPKPGPVTAAWVRVRLAVPVFCTVTDWVLVAPSVTLPNATELGKTFIVGCTPFPFRRIAAGEFVASLTTETLP